jgi:segregation and condensation protein B
MNPRQNTASSIPNLQSPIPDPQSPASDPQAPLGLETFQQPLPDQGLSLHDLSQAFAGMMGAGEDPYAEPAPEEDQDDACEVSPRSILEAMLFVGSRDNQPLSSARVAGMMRGVRAVEIDELVRELNQQYDANGCPYRICSEADGYRLLLREEFSRIRDKFYGRQRQARLSPAAIEVLSIIAYQGSQTSEEVHRLRGTPSGAILSQLVRRQLLRIERDPAAPRSPRYHTTARFLELFGLESLDDLPRSQEVDKR